MSNLNVALFTSQSALLANQKKMNVVANNLANIDQEGYHRQIALTQNNNPINTPLGQFGTGSHVFQIVRSFDNALETSLRQAHSSEGNTTTYADQLYYLEGTLAPDGTSSLAESVLDFSDAIQQLANRPEATDARLDLLAKAEVMVTQINETYGQITTQRDGILDATNEGALSDKVDELNRIITEITDVNTQIAKAEVRIFNPTQANDLRDQRDQLVAELSKITDLTVTEDPNKAYSISIGGQKIVDGANLTNDTLSVAMAGTPAVPTLTWANGGTPVGATISDGEIAGLTRAWSYVDTKATELWTYASDLTTAVNIQHAAGFYPSGNPGGAFFDVAVTGRMTLLINDPDYLAASDSATESGSGANMLSMWDTLKSNGHTSGADAYVNTISTDTAAARASADAATAGRQMFEDSIATLSGVSIDEEMMDMLTVQRAFQASSRIISTVDEMIQTALNMI